MVDSGAITARILEALLEAGFITVEQSSSAIHAAEMEGRSVGELLAERELVPPDELASVLEDALGIPRVELASYAPDADALALMPATTAHKLRVLPLFEIEGMLTVAVGDPFDVFRLDALGAEMDLEVESVLADPASVAEAIAQYYPDVTPAEEPETAEVAEEFDASDFFDAPAHETPPAAEPSIAPAPEDTHDAAENVETLEQVVQTEVAGRAEGIDLDILAVADTAKVSVLVTDILKHAVEHGASRIHVFPYKDDFFLVYRVAGKLEKIGSAPLSLQGALVEGLKHFARLGGIQSTTPALGRLRARIADRELVVTVSSVPTISGQRVVVSFSSATDTPRSLSRLGMSDAETFAINAMVERGRGILLVCAPVAGGRSSTYYALLAHAAAAGRTVYSVERSIEYEIPAVAQVLVSPSSPVSAAAYFSAGMRQDTDVMAIDALQSVEDVHLAIEAAGMGKLVIVTYSGGDIVSGISRMLEMGAEPVSLAAALTLGVGQRLVRLTCQNCVQEEPAGLASRIPGAPTGIASTRGAGCPACANTGFAGATGVFEVLPFTDSVRTVISRGASADDITAAATAAGMRPMVASGLAKVQEGVISAAELNRVLRFAG